MTATGRAVGALGTGQYAEVNGVNPWFRRGVRVGAEQQPARLLRRRRSLSCTPVSRTCYEVQVVGAKMVIQT